MASLQEDYEDLIGMYGELQEENRDKIRYVEGWNQQRVDWWTVNCRELEKQNKQHHDASRGKDEEIEELKRQRQADLDSQETELNKYWFNKNQELKTQHEKASIEKASIKKDGKLSQLRGSYQASANKVRELNKDLDTSRQENERLESRLQISTSESQGLVENLASSRQETEKLTAKLEKRDSDWTRVTKEAQSLHEDDIHSRDQALQRKDEEHQQLFDGFKGLLAERDAKIAGLDEEIAALRSDATTSERDESETDKEISDLKTHQAEILDEKDHAHQKLIKDKDDEHQELMAEKAAEIDKRGGEIATLRGIVRSDAMTSEGADSEEARLKNALTRQWDITDAVGLQMKELEKENEDLRNDVRLHRAGRNNKKATQMRQEATEERRERRAEQETGEQIIAPQTPVAPRAHTAPVAPQTPTAPFTGRGPIAPFAGRTRAAPNAMNGLSRSRWAR
jgi:myosin heavy subunit